MTTNTPTKRKAPAEGLASHSGDIYAAGHQSGNANPLSSTDPNTTEAPTPTGIAMLIEFRLKLERDIAQRKLERLDKFVAAFERLNRGLKRDANRTPGEIAFWAGWRKGLRGEVK